MCPAIPEIPGNKNLYAPTPAAFPVPGGGALLLRLSELSESPRAAIPTLLSNINGCIIYNKYRNHYIARPSPFTILVLKLQPLELLPEYAVGIAFFRAVCYTGSILRMEKKNMNDTEERELLGETKTDSESIFDGIILHVLSDTVTLPNGKPATRELLRHVGAVCVLPVTEDGRVVVERQFRYPVDEVLTEIPAGKLDSKTEDRLAAAKRELREETGYTADRWTSLGDFYPAPAYSDEKLTLYLAQGLHRGAQALDADEFLQVETVPLATLVDEVMAGRIPDAKTQLAILKAAAVLRAAR